MSIVDAWRRKALCFVLTACVSYFGAATAVAGPSSVTVFSPQIDAASVQQTLYFPVTRNGDAGYDISLNYQTVDGSAVAGVDYVAAAGAAILPTQAPGLFLPATIKPTTFGGNTKTFQLLLNSAVGVGPQPSFGSRQDFGTNGAGTPIAVDLNGDGRLDLVYPRGISLAARINTTAPGVAVTSFSSEQLFSVGNGRNFIAVGDINGDGRIDVVLTNQSDNTVSVFLNTTAPGALAASFSPQTVFSTGNSPQAVVLVDINGDGRKDIVVTNTSDGTISILLNTTATGMTTASFGNAQSFSTGTYALSVAAADINGDGRQDLVVANSRANTVSVLANTTTINSSTVSFAQPQQLTVAWPSAVIAVDLNGDGRPDIVASSNSNNGTIAVWTNTTQPGSETTSFSTPTFFPVGNYSISVAAADLNGDGLLDLVVANSGYSGQSQNFVSVLRNTTPAGAAAPHFDVQQPVVTPESPSGAIVADLNGDGRSDLIVGYYGVGPIFSTFLSTTPATAAVASFGSSSQYTAGATPSSVVTADLNGDGLPDIVTANYQGASVSIFVNNRAPGSSAPSFYPQEVFDCGESPDSLAVVDMNGDGRPDVVVGNTGTQSVNILLNTTSSGSSALTFQPAQTVDTNGMIVSEVVAIDLNGDKKQDLVVFGALGVDPKMMVFFNTTPPGLSILSFSEPQTFGVHLRTDSVPSHADLNGDGLQDLIFPKSNVMEVLLNKTVPGSFTAKFSEPQDFFVPPLSFSMTVVDLNGDGRPDVAMATFQGLSILLNTTAAGSDTASFTAGTTFLTGGSAGFPTDLSVRDVDGDGKPDFLVVNGGDSVALLTNTTAPGGLTMSVGAPVVLTSDSSPYKLAAADVTGDGAVDLITSDQNGAISVAVNTTLAARVAVGAATGTIVHDEIFENGFD